MVDNERLEVHFHAVEFVDAALTALADLVGVKEFHLARAFVVVVFDGDAVFPFLYFSASCP